MNPRIEAWKREQKARCRKWIGGRQCGNPRDRGERFCTLHRAPRENGAAT